MMLAQARYFRLYQARSGVTLEPGDPRKLRIFFGQQAGDELEAARHVVLRRLLEMIIVIVLLAPVAILVSLLLPP